jgi:hypothetical protein
LIPESGFPPETITDYKERLSVLHEKVIERDIIEYDYTYTFPI